jgi:hypothetical protein
MSLIPLHMNFSHPRKSEGVELRGDSGVSHTIVAAISIAACIFLAGCASDGTPTNIAGCAKNPSCPAFNNGNKVDRYAEGRAAAERPAATRSAMAQP